MLDQNRDRIRLWIEGDEKFFIFELRHSSFSLAFVPTELPAYFIKAGLGEPDGTQVDCRILPLRDSAAMLEGTYRGLLPSALELGITHEAASERFLRELRQAALSGCHTAMWPMLVSAWKRV